MYVLDFQPVQQTDVVFAYQPYIQALSKINVGVLAESKLL
jgi:hypothetical protein